MKKKTNGDHASGLLTKAEHDFIMIRLVLNNEGPYDGACFHAQQAIEKMLKALLAFHDFEYPKTHDLEEIQHLCLRIIPGLPIGDFDFETITPYATNSRYDVHSDPNLDLANDAYDVALEIRKIVYDTLPSDVHPDFKNDNQ